MHQGNWKCSSCGGAITELPFEPRSEQGLVCRTCYSKQKGQQQSNEIPVATEEAPPIPDDAMPATEPQPDDPTEKTVPLSADGGRPKFSGDWKCASCGGAIPSLPFEPRNTSNLKCIDCFKKSKGN